MTEHLYRRLAAIFAVACGFSPFACVLSQPPKPASPDVILIASAVQLKEASDHYASGDDSTNDEKSKSFFRQVCKLHQLEREQLLDFMHERAGVHAYIWKDYYERNCTPLLVGDLIADPGVGLIERPYMCRSDAGTPPAKTYERSSEEKLAQRQRDACERAQ